MSRVTKYILICVFIEFLSGCKEAYQPPAIKDNKHYLVVEGAINVSPDSKTTINLSRTRNIADTFPVPELNAQVQIEAKTGNVYSLQGQGDGKYVTDHLTLNPADTYRLRILTSDGNDYASDFVPVKQTPPIDSITWKQDNDVTLYVNTHDPQNNTWYYRWEYEETWSYKAPLETLLAVKGGMMYYTDSSNQITECWRNAHSTDIILGTSIKLSQDKIDHAPLTTIVHDNERLWVRYSVLVRQYGLTEDAYNYWQILKKNTQQLGTLFDPQPSHLVSNMHNNTHPDEPVIGYVSACVVQEKRMFIEHRDISNWLGGITRNDCQLVATVQNPFNYLIYDFPDPSYGPFYFTSGGGLILAKTFCLDCRQYGGSNHKPAFW
jgi:hypothetical protein